MKRPYRIRLLIAALSAAVLLGSCRKELEYPVPGPVRTVVAYVAVDNDLDTDLSGKIAALAQGRRNALGGELLVYADAPSGARLLRALPDGNMETVAEYGTENSASADVMGRVLREAMASYPADGYGLLFVSHGSGWLPYGTLQRPSRSMGWDDNAGDGSPAEGTHTEMELDAFAAAIPDGSLDFIVFEACLMAGAEVAYALRDKAECMLASSAEILSPGFTPVYGSSLKYLLDASRPAAECLTVFGQAYMNHVATLQGVHRSATLSVVDLREMEPLAARAAGLLPLSDRESDITSGLQHFDRPGSYGDRPARPRYFDLGACVRKYASPAEAELFRAQLERTVSWAAHTERFMVSGDDYGRYNGFDIADHSGLTVYLPQPEFEALNEAHRRTEWYRAVSGGNAK